MLSVIRSRAPELLKLAREYALADAQSDQATTHLTKTAFILEKVSSREKLLASAIKLGSEVLKSLKSSGLEEELLKTKKKKKIKEASISIPKALGLGTVAAVPGALAANHFINRASDEVDSKMYAIPGIAAATIAAILAAKNSGLGESVVTKKEASMVSELHSALECGEVIKQAQLNTGLDTTPDLEKISNLNKEHTAILISNILGT